MILWMTLLIQETRKLILVFIRDINCSVSWQYDTLQQKFNRDSFQNLRKFLPKYITRGEDIPLSQNVREEVT